MGLIELKYTPLFLVMELGIVFLYFKRHIKRKNRFNSLLILNFKTKEQKNTVWIIDDETTLHSTNIIKRVRTEKGSYLRLVIYG